MTLETGLSARRNVVEESKRETDNVTTLFLTPVVQTVKERNLKLKLVTPTNAQVINPCVYAVIELAAIKLSLAELTFYMLPSILKPKG